MTPDQAVAAFKVARTKFKDPDIRTLVADPEKVRAWGARPTPGE